MENKNRKKITMNALFMILTVLLSGGFVAASTGTVNMNSEDRQADNSGQERAFASATASTLSQSVAQDCHSHQRCYVHSPRRNKNRNGKNRKTNNGKKAPLTAADASCNKSVGLNEWNRKMKKTQRNQNPGTKFQKKSQLALGLKSPFVVAETLSSDLVFNCIQGTTSLQSALNKGSVRILENETRRIRDPAVKLDYLLHVFVNYGRAVGKSPHRAALTLTTTHLVNVINHIAASGVLVKDSAFGNYQVDIRPHTIAKDVKGITPIVNSILYGRKKTPFQILVRRKANDGLDNYIKEQMTEKPDYEAEAATVLQGYIQVVKDMETGVQGAMNRFQDIPEEYQSAVMKFKADGASMKTHPEGSDKFIELSVSADAHMTKFIEQYVNQQQSPDITREDHLRNYNKILLDEALADNRESRHSWEIRIVRTTGKKTEVLLQWHLSHMSTHREKAKAIVENSHEGAKYLLGPTNGVRMPERVNRGYAAGAEDMVKHGGSKAYTGDAASLQVIMYGGQNPNAFDVRNNMTTKEVATVNGRRDNLKALLTLVNVVMGTTHKVPGNESWRLAGLYTHPGLLEEGRVGQMRAVAVDSWEAKGTPANTPRRNTNKNQRKNRAAAKAAEVDAKDENEATKDEVNNWNESQNALIPDAEPVELPAPPISKDTLLNRTVAALRDECRQENIKVSGLKLELVERLFDHYEGGTVEQISLETADLLKEMNDLHGPSSTSSDPVWTKPSGSKKKKTTPVDTTSTRRRTRKNNKS